MSKLTVMFSNSAKGKKVWAKYEKHTQESLNGNACTEVFKPRWDRGEVSEFMRKKVNRKPSIRNASPVDRIYSCQDLLYLFEPLPIHWHVERAFSDNLRRGYQARNPLSKDYWNYLEEHARQILEAVSGKQAQTEAQDALKSMVSEAQQEASNPVATIYEMEDSQSYDPSEGDEDFIPLVLAILGDSGTGKSRTMRLIARLYPKLIVHKDYPDDPYKLLDGMQQIVTIIQEAPANGSLRTFCLNIFAEIDGLVGTNYRGEFANKTVDLMLSYFPYLIRKYCIGTFIFDELQRFVGRPDEQKAINFFETMIGQGVPCVLIGTEAAYELLSQTFSSGRRLSGTRGLVEFKRLPNDGVWEYFLNTCIWKYQYTSVETPFSQEISDAFYYETQGVIDLTIKLYIMVQINLIEQSERNPKLSELITPKVIHQTAQQGFKHLQRKLRNLRLGKDDELKPEELRQIDIEQYIHLIVAKMLENQKSDLAFLKSQQEQDSQAPTPQPGTNAKGEKKRKTKADTNAVSPTGIAAAFFEAKDSEVPFYEVLRSKGYVHQLHEIFPEISSL